MVVRRLAVSVWNAVMGTSDSLTTTIVPLASPSTSKPLLEKKMERAMRNPMPSGSSSVPKR